MTPTLRVAEVFTSLQGEGPYAGRLASFVRLMGCNLSCGYCDTAWTWDSHSAVRRNTVRATAAELICDLSASLVVLTGGEPLLQQNQPAWDDLILGASPRVVQVETNGTLAPSSTTAKTVTTFVVSPKLGNAGPHRGRQTAAVHPFWLSPDAARLDVHWKFVCQSVRDADLAVEYTDHAGWPRDRVWLMPEAVSSDALAVLWPTIADTAVQYGVNASHRLHVLAWGSQRGR